MIQFTAHNTSFKTPNKDIVPNLLKKRESLGFIDIDTSLDLGSIQSYVSQVEDLFDSIVILWIGWSALATKALLESLYGKYYNEDQNKSWKNIYVLDNIDPETFHDVERIIDIKRTLFVFISKSGGTIETLSEYLYYREKCRQVSDNWEKHFCFIVGENCKMRQELEKDFQTFYIPENIWGRFSVFTAVGLLPLAFSGIDIQWFIDGIKEIKESCISQSIDENIAFQLACTQYEQYKQGRNISVFFPYSSRLFQVGEWYKQLMGESIWKWWDGITLTSSLWVTDQHSQLQLYQDGPDDKLYITLWVSESEDIQISTEIKNYSFKKLLDIEKYGTETSLRNEGRPVCNIQLKKLDSINIWALLYTLMFQIAYLWELFWINAFDQPWVEKSKIITKQKLREELGDIDVFQKAFYG